MTAQGDNSGRPEAAAWQRMVPNALTMGRVVLAAAFFAMLAVWRYDDSPLAAGQGKDPWLLAAAAVFIAAAVTDALDGYLARKWKVVSVFGRVMDPFADKVLIIGAFVMLAGPGFWWAQAPLGYLRLSDGTINWRFGGVQVSGVATWMAVVVLARELLVTSIRAAYEGRGVSFAATASGKLKMILQCVAVPLVLLLVAIGGGHGAISGPSVPSGDIPSIGGAVLTGTIQGTVWLTVAVTAWSGVPYVLRAIRESGKLAETKG